MPAVVPPLPVVSAEGVRLKLADGRELIDGMASWWCAIHGYRNPEIDEAVREQLDRMAHVMFGGLTHEGAIRLAERLTDWTGLDHVFFADSGSVSVEVAIKLVLQYWHGERRKLLTWRGGYHGDTFGAMAVCDPDGGMHSMWKGTLAEHVFAPLPEWTPEWEQAVRQLFEDHDDLAGVIVEPIVQGAGGMRFHPPECVALLRELCDTHEVPLVLDEIATGFGRTGTLFAAAEHADILCLGKALTGGYMTLAATLCTAAVAERLNGPLMHGPTFMANPLATAAALASTNILSNGAWRSDVARIETGLSAGLQDVSGSRVKGAIGVIELDAPVDVAGVTAVAVEHGVWLRPFRNLIYTMPPYITSDEDLTRITEAMVACASS
ncbi:adenosylmethionine--8-amino-7-oxononanoate transaminase [Solirubrobacter ginsenosidimutans]